MKTGQVEYRRLSLDSARANSEERTIPASISSEEPVERWFGIEILDHTLEAIDLSRVVNGALPLLESHDPDKLPRPGNVEAIRLAGRKLRGTLRFADTDRGRELWQAIEDGFLEGISIGYRILEAEQDGTDQESGLPIFHARRWQLLEVSLVNLAADMSVGIGRSADFTKGRKTMKTGQAGNTPVIDDDKDMNDGPAVEAERRRARELLAMGKAHKLEDLAERAIRDGTSVDQFRRIGMEALEKRSSRPLETAPAVGDWSFGIGRELGRYSLQRALAGMVTGDFSQAGFEMEVSRHLGKLRGKESSGVLVPFGALATRATMTVGGGAASAALVGVEHMAGMFIDLLRPRSACVAAGATVLDGLVQSVDIPRLSTGATAYWIAESGDLTESSPATDSVTMTPNTFGALATWSRRTLVQSLPAVEEILRNDFIQKIATAVDVVAIKGGGANQPTGILGTVGIGSVTVGNTSIDWDTITKLIGEVATDNALAGSLNFLVHPRVMAQAMRAPVDTGSGIFCWAAPPAGSMADGSMGYKPAYSTSNVPTNLGVGQNRTAAIFGNFADLLIGFWGVAEILSDPYKYFEKGDVRLRILWEADVKLRHPESFAACQDIDPAA